MNTAINIALFVGVLAVMVGIQAIPNHGAEHETARQELAKQRQQEQEERFNRAAQAMCGDQAAWERINETTVQCFMHTGRKTFKGTL